MSLTPRDGTRSIRVIRARATDREVRLLAEIQRRAGSADQSDALRFCLHHGALAVGITQPSTWGVEPEEAELSDVFALPASMEVVTVGGAPNYGGPCPDGIACRAFGCTPTDCKHPF